jgi:hypothetical protein
MNMDVDERADAGRGGELKIKGQAEVEKRKGKSKWDEDDMVSFMCSMVMLLDPKLCRWMVTTGRGRI